MLDPLFQEAFCHAPRGHTVLGRKLHPLCAFDLLTLETINSPFLLDDGTAEIADLVLAVWILSNSIPEDLCIGNLELGDAGKQWLESIRGEIDPVRDCAAVETYIKDYYSLPEIMAQIAKNPITATGAPWMLSTVISVCHYIHISERRAWTMGIGQLIWYRASISELENPDARIVSPELREHMNANAKGPKVFQMQPGETLAEFAARVGISEQQAAFMLHNGGK